MNLLQALKRPFESMMNLLGRSSFEDQAIAFLAATLKEPNACLLLTDPRQESMYESVLNRLRSVDGFLGHSLFDHFRETPWSDVVIIHSHFDPVLLQEVANSDFVRRIIYIAEYGDLGTGEQMDTLIDKRNLRQGDQVDVTFAFYAKSSSYSQQPISNDDLHSMDCRIGANRQ